MLNRSLSDMVLRNVDKALPDVDAVDPNVSGGGIEGVAYQLASDESSSRWLL